MKNSESNIEIILIFIRLVWFWLFGSLFYYGIRIFLFKRLDTNSFSFIGPIENLLPTGDIYISHLSLGSSFAVISVFYFFFHIFIRYFNKGENKHSVFYFLPLYLMLTLLILSGLASYYNFFDTFISQNSLNKIHLALAWVTPILFLIYLLLFFIIRKRIKRNYLFSKTERMLVIVISTIAALPVLYLVRFKLFLPNEIVCAEQNRYVNIDGKESDLEWLGVEEIKLTLNQGANFEQGMTNVKLKTFRNNHYIYFLLKWQDPTPSFNRFLEKTEGGWIEIKSEPKPLFGETVYYEDMLALSFHENNNNCLQSCHLGSTAKPGLHNYVNQKADLWLWKSISTNPYVQAEDGWWGGDSLDLITGSRHIDNKAGGGANLNFNFQWNEPYFLPDSKFMRYFIDLTSDKFVSYRAELDTFSIGSRIPAIMVAPAMGDVSDVRAHGRWRGGEWVLEIARTRGTGSLNDFALMGELILGIAIFDNAEKNHAFHMNPIKLIFE